MILTGLQIKEEVLNGGITIEDFDESRLSPNSYNLRLGDEIAFYNDALLDMREDNPVTTTKIPAGGFVLEPGTLYLASTMEHTSTNKFAPMLEGRSSVGRLGLFVHVTAGFGDCGFSGRWTLELACVQPIRIYAGVEIAQIYFHELAGERLFYGYGGRAKYNNAERLLPSKLFEDFKRLQKEGQCRGI